MKLQTILLLLGIKKTPKFSAQFCANHPATGTFYTVTFTDGLWGIVRDPHNGTFSPQGKCVPGDRKKTFVNFGDAAQALYRSLVEYGPVKLAGK